MTKRFRIQRARAGGLARGWEERKTALLRYHTRPHFCANCGHMIEVGERRVADVMKKKFCNSSCAASYNNVKFPSRYKHLDQPTTNIER